MLILNITQHYEGSVIMKFLSFCGIGIAGLAPLFASALNIEAETVLVKPEKLPLNDSGARGWSLWSQDKNAKAWSGGVTLRNFKADHIDRGMPDFCLINKLL